jgi:hypothetical protein
MVVDSVVQAGKMRITFSQRDAFCLTEVFTLKNRFCQFCSIESYINRCIFILVYRYRFLSDVVSDFSGWDA